MHYSEIWARELHTNGNSLLRYLTYSLDWHCYLYRPVHYSLVSLRHSLISFGIESMINDRLIVRWFIWNVKVDNIEEYTLAEKKRWSLPGRFVSYNP